jgi:flavin reductase (DIM6/NTAB) family NADH-FMN oxidoreductase RutF
MSEITARFEAAVSTLITDGPVKKRLVQAYSSHLEDLTEVDIPPQSGDALAKLHCSLHEIAPVGRESAVQASVQKMSANEATEHAAAIFELYRELVTIERRGEHLRVVKSAAEEEDAPPNFLVGAT